MHGRRPQSHAMLGQIEAEVARARQELERAKAQCLFCTWIKFCFTEHILFWFLAVVGQLKLNCFSFSQVVAYIKIPLITKLFAVPLSDYCMPLVEYWMYRSIHQVMDFLGDLGQMLANKIFGKVPQPRLCNPVPTADQSIPQCQRAFKTIENNSIVCPDIHCFVWVAPVRIRHQLALNWALPDRMARP